MNVLPEYLEGNRTGSYTPEQWLDEVKDKNSDEIIQEGTPMDVFLHLICYIFITCKMEIIKYLCFDPTVDYFHGSVICWSTSSRH